MKCDWCEDTKVVFLGTGPQTEPFDCPICIRPSKDALYGLYLEDAIRIAETYGLTIKWSE